MSPFSLPSPYVYPFRNLFPPCLPLSLQSLTSWLRSPWPSLPSLPSLWLPPEDWGSCGSSLHTSVSYFHSTREPGQEHFQARVRILPGYCFLRYSPTLSPVANLNTGIITPLCRRVIERSPWPIVGLSSILNGAFPAELTPPFTS